MVLNTSKSKLIVHNTRIYIFIYTYLYLLFLAEIRSKFENENLSKSFRPKWGFVKSIPGAVAERRDEDRAALAERVEGHLVVLQQVQHLRVCRLQQKRKFTDPGSMLWIFKKVAQGWRPG
jgi:hypothetical protein